MFCEALISAVFKSSFSLPRCSSVLECFLFLIFLFPSASMLFLSLCCLQLLPQTESPPAVSSALQLAPAKPGQPGSKTQGQLEERPGWLPTMNDKHVTMNTGWNTQGSVCYMERERLKGKQSWTKVKRDDTVSNAFNHRQSITLSCIFYTEGTIGLCHESKISLC